MTTIYMGGRQSGKTTTLIKESARTRAVIAVPTYHMAMYVQYMAGELGLDIPAPVSYDQMFQRCTTDRSTRYLVDEAQALLRHMNVDAVTMNVRSGVPEDVDVRSLKNGNIVHDTEVGKLVVNSTPYCKDCRHFSPFARTGWITDDENKPKFDEFGHPIYNGTVIQCEHFYMCQNVRKTLIEKMKDLGEIR